MLSIFFDLETSDIFNTGQILNYSFIVVNQNWDQVDELTASIKISPLQLPMPGAILTNRVNVKQQQIEAKETEAQAAEKIFNFLEKYCNQTQTGVNLIGYNSNNFDIPFLRTVLIRNGFNPFFSGRLHYRDLFHLVKKLACTEKDFPRVIKTDANGYQSYSFSLQNITTALELLKNEQTHYSRDDVVLSIELAKALQKKYQGDIRKFKSNEAEEIRDAGKIIFSMIPEYEPESQGLARTTPLMLLRSTTSGSFWVNLNVFQNGQPDNSAIISISKLKALFVANEPVTPELKEIANRAQIRFKNFKPEDFYSPSTCYIEQDIYRLFQGKRFDRLLEVIRTAQIESNEDDEVRLLFTRYQLENFDWSKLPEEQGFLWESLSEYIKMLYGGELQLSRHEADENDPNQKTTYAPSFQQLFEEINKKLSEDLPAEDRVLLEELQKHYLNSLVNKAGRFIVTN